MIGSAILIVLSAAVITRNVAVLPEFEAGSSGTADFLLPKVLGQLWEIHQFIGGRDHRIITLRCSQEALCPKI